MGPQFTTPDWTKFSLAYSTRIQVTKSHTKGTGTCTFFFHPGLTFTAILSGSSQPLVASELFSLTRSFNALVLYLIPLPSLPIEC
jgi:hypothetical protein